MKLFLQTFSVISILSLTYLLVMAQTPFNYDNAWKKVETAIEQGKPKTALEEINKIYIQAKKDNKEAQLIKAIVYKSQTIQQTEEDSWIKNIRSLEQEITHAREPVKQLLYSITAELYYSYFQNNRWRIYERTTTTVTDANNPETWSASDFNAKITAYFTRSLANPKLLQETNLANFEPIITKGNVRNLRPTLYDLLAHNALDYWKNDESEITKPIGAFELNHHAALANAKIFSRYKFETTDSGSHTFKAITLYQDLIRFHLQDEKPDALIDLDVARIQFAHDKGVMQGKNQFYKEALEHIYVTYGKNEQAMQAGHLLAAWWQQKGAAYNATTGTVEDRMAYAIALEYAEKVVKAFPKSEGGIASKMLVSELKRPVIGLVTEKANVINKPFRALLSFKNLSKVYLRIVPLPAGFDEEGLFFESDESYWTRITSLTPLRAWTQALPETKDLREHRAEIKIEGLPQGRYLVIGAMDPNFSIGNAALASSEFHVSNISFINTGNNYFILHRENGQPLSDATVQVWYSRYDYSKRKNVLNKGEQLIADKNGYVQLSGNKGTERYEGQIRLEVKTKHDYLFLSDPQERVYRPQPNSTRSKSAFEQDNARYYFFTDRSIYRPGQSLYFKAIGVTREFESGKPMLFKPESIEITLRNANYEQVAVQTLVPGNYGSIHGNFLLPATGLTGNFTLQIKNGERTWQHSIRVEEYKRPKFSVEFTPVKDAFKLNQEIKAIGVAKGFAGNPIDGARVSYRVKRAIRFAYPWKLGFGRGGYWPPIMRGSDMEIAHGTTLTNTDGSFEVKFTALPDLSVDKNLDPHFDFIIEAVVTDINGETRSAETTLAVGYKSMLLSVQTGVNDMLPADSTLTLLVNQTNLNGQPVQAPVMVKIVALKSPERLLRKRLWADPDTFVLSRSEFEKNFPNDPYDHEDDFRKWEDAKTILTTRLDKMGGDEFKVKPGTFLPGYYRVEAITMDADGQEIKAIEFFSVFDKQKRQLPAPSYLEQYIEKQTIEPGEKAIFWQSSSIAGGFIVQQIQKKRFSPESQAPDEEASAFEYLNTSSGVEAFQFSATEEDRGGYRVTRSMVYQNRVYTLTWMVNVPWSNKDLKISLETFRDKLKPGQEETWKIRIAGLKGELVAAEMLAGMYDASLDQFSPHQWERVNPWTLNTFFTRWGNGGNFSPSIGRYKFWNEEFEQFLKQYDELIRIEGFYSRMMIRGAASGIDISGANRMEEVVVTAMAAPSTKKFTPPAVVADSEGMNKEMAEQVNPESNKVNPESYSGIQIRKNFNETAFFFPALETDKQGNISFSFTMPEALTQWKLQLLAHTSDARFAYESRTLVTQKELMVIPNPPRFFRQGDNMEFSVKVSNLTEKEMTGQVQLELLNATTMQPVDGWFRNIFPNQYFTVEAGQSAAVRFPIEIPYQFNDAVVYRVVARSGETGDGEEMALPVLTNRMLVTESFPLNLRGTDQKTFSWNRFTELTGAAKEAGGIEHHSLTVEYTTNPVWYAIQALPYIMEYPYDCAEQTWNRFYANALAGNIARKTPRIRQIFESWKQKTPDALLSNLQKNQALKSALLEETPWVLQAKSEEEQKKNIALLFDLVRMDKESSAALDKLKELQSPNGGFVWFKGGRDDRYMTQYILTGMGHLRKLNAVPEEHIAFLNTMIERAIPYADSRIKEEYEELMKQKVSSGTNQLTSFATQYLYMRSFFPEISIKPEAAKAVEFFKEQARTHWQKGSKYQQGMIALALHRMGDTKVPMAILTSLTENSITHPEFGMYWKEFNNPGRYWWEAPIESHALLMEAYYEIENNATRIDDLRTWLLKQKQTTNWKTTKATAEACYALLMRGTDWLSEERTVSIDLGGYQVSSAGSDKTEAGTGYFKQMINSEKITPGMGTIKVQMSSSSNKKQPSATSWGAVYWQYFEDLDRITPAESNVAIKKELFVLQNTDKGPVMQPLGAGKNLKVGDRVKVRVIIVNDRQLEYVHLKDMRAACFEPLNVLSGYKFQGGLGYYESTRDASSNFFISYLPRGTWVFEYELRATMGGEFSNGITTLQCMYAPEFSSHSQGIRVRVE